MNDFAFSALWLATGQTIYMVFLASALGIFFGLLIGIVLFLSQPDQVWHNKYLQAVLGFIVNVGRSVPFIILLVALIPLTRLLVGTSIGINAAVVPLVIAAIPFYARGVESAFAEVPGGLQEAAHAMGASHWQLIFRVILPESLPALIRGATLTVIGLIGYSAMAGAVGGGGLGELAINYGYQRFNVLVMLETIVILVLLVQVLQSLGDRIAKTRQFRMLGISLGAIFLVILTFWFWPKPVVTSNTLKVGIMSGVEQKIMATAKQVAWRRYHLHVRFIPFSDYVLPNVALNEGEIDANIFQHVPYLNAQIKARGFHLVPIAKTFVYPMGFYSKKIKSLAQLKDNSIVAIPNDPSNEGRALLLLQKSGLIRLNKKSGLFATKKDIIANPKHLRFNEIDAAQLPRVFHDASLVALTNDFVGPAGFKVDQALLREGAHSPYANVVVVKKGSQHDPLFTLLVKALHDPAVVKATLKAFPGGGAIPAFLVPKAKTT
jgi:D-methionine transport system permease protein